MRATKVNAGLAESNGKLLLGIWRDSLHVTCGLTACTPGSALGPTLGNEYGKTLPLLYLDQSSPSHPIRTGLNRRLKTSRITPGTLKCWQARWRCADLPRLSRALDYWRFLRLTALQTVFSHPCLAMSNFKEPELELEAGTTKYLSLANLTVRLLVVKGRRSAAVTMS